MMRCFAKSVERTAEGFMYAQPTTISKATSQVIKEKNFLESHPTKKGSRNRITKDLPYQVEIAIGKPPIAQGAVVKLRYLPAYILIKLSWTKASKLTGLDDCVIPVEPPSTTYQMTMTTKGGKKDHALFEDANFLSQQLIPSRIIILKVRPLPMY